jgi:hypothetical protein
MSRPLTTDTCPRRSAAGRDKPGTNKGDQPTGEGRRRRLAEGKQNWSRR